MLKKMATVLSVVVLATAASITAQAGVWKKDNVGWWWQNDDGSYPVSKWEWLDGNQDGVAECYYFNEIGYMLADTTTPDGYTVNADGAWVVNGVVQTQTSRNSASNITRGSNTTNASRVSSSSSSNTLSSNTSSGNTSSGNTSSSNTSSSDTSSNNTSSSDTPSSDTSNGIVFPSAGMTLYDDDSSFYVSSIRMDVIGYLESSGKYKVSYQVEGTLYGDRQVAAYFNCYSADGALLEHRIEIFRGSGMTSDTMNIPGNTVRIELVGADPTPRPSDSSSSDTSNGSSSDDNSSNSSSDKETEPAEEVITPEEFLNRLEYDSGPMEFSGSASTTVTVSNFTLSNPRRATSKKVRLDYSFTWYSTFSEGQLSSIGNFQWYGYDDEGNQYNLGFSTWLSTERDGVEQTKTGSLTLDSRITRLELTAEIRY